MDSFHRVGVVVHPKTSVKVKPKGLKPPAPVYKKKISKKMSQSSQGLRGGRSLLVSLILRFCSVKAYFEVCKLAEYFVSTTTFDQYDLNLLEISVSPHILPKLDSSQAPRPHQNNRHYSHN